MFFCEGCFFGVNLHHQNWTLSCVCSCFFWVKLKNKTKMVIRFANNHIEGEGKITRLLHLVLIVTINIEQ
jgi:hypothetical protein